MPDAESLIDRNPLKDIISSGEEALSFVANPEEVKNSIESLLAGAERNIFPASI